MNYQPFLQIVHKYHQHAFEVQLSLFSPGCVHILKKSHEQKEERKRKKLNKGKNRSLLTILMTVPRVRLEI